MAIKKQLRLEHNVELHRETDRVMSALPESLRCCITWAQEKGASSWLAALSVKRFGFVLHKGAFWDALCLCYGWELRLVPERCRCGAQFETNHVFMCRHGGNPTKRHNELRDVLADLLREVCTDVATEPQLQRLSGEQLPASANTQDEARLDIRAKGFWDRQQAAFFDERIFYPAAPSYRNSTLKSVYRQHELKKRAEYGQRVRDVELGSFTPLVLAIGSGMAPESAVFFRRLASMLAEK